MDAAAAVRARLVWWQWCGLGAAALAVLALAALAVAERHLKGALSRSLSARVQREVRIDGPLEARLLSLHPTLTARDVTVANPAWVAPGELAHLERVALTLQWQFGLSPLQILTARVTGASLHLSRDANGHANYHVRAAGPGSGPPLMRSLSMPDMQVELDDVRGHVRFSGTVSIGEEPQPSGAPRLRISGAGSLNGRPGSFAVDGDPLATARHGHPYGFDVVEDSEGSHLSGHGVLPDPFDIRNLQGSFEVTGPNLRDLYYLVGLKLLETGPYHLTGKLAREGKRFTYTDLAVNSGDSDLGGSLTVASSHGHTSIEGQLQSRRLRLRDLGPAGRPAPATPDDLRIPDTPFRLGGMQDTDLSLGFRADTLELGSAAGVHAAVATFRLDHGVLSLSKLKGSLGSGDVSGRARLDATHEPPRGEVDLTFSGVQLDELAPKGASAPVGGVVSGRIQLSGEGKSLHQMAATANGSLNMAIPHGTMRATLAQLASLDLAGALGVLRKDQTETAIRCAVASLDAQAGKLTVRTLALDTDKVLISGRGGADLDTEDLDLTLHGSPKHMTVGLHSDVAIKGTLRHPQMSLAGHGALAQTGAAAALGAVLTPVAAVLAFINPGLAQDADCAALLAEADTKAAAPRSAKR